jgi:hypothetical protein
MERLTFCLSVVLLVAGSAEGQIPGAGTISGTVTDPQGAVIPGATVTLVEPATTVQRRIQSNEVGQFVFANVLPGSYDIRAEAAGFQTAIAAGLKLEVGTALVQDITLRIGSVTTKIEVAASGERPLERTDSSLGSVIRMEMVRRLPNLVRDAGQLLAQQPGVTPLGEITGARRDQSTFLLDGVDVSDNYSGSGATGFRAVIPLPVESIQEFRAIVANPSASFGRGAGAQVVVQTRRGTNVLHGSGYWYHRNDGLNANSWEGNRLGQPRPSESDHRFGVTAGGPIRRDRTFFFTHYEGRRRREPTRVVRIVPTESLRAGLLRFRDGQDNIQTIDPRSFDPRGLGASPAILQFLQRYPAGNDVSQGDGLNTTGFSTVLPTPIHDRFGLLRVDHELSNRWRFEGSARLSDSTQVSATQVDLINRLPVSRQVTRPHHVAAAATTILTPRLTNQFQFGWTRDSVVDERQRPVAIPPFNVALDLAGSMMDEPVDVSTFRASGQGVKADYYRLSDHLHWHRGKHQIQSGFTLRAIESSSFRDDRTLAASTTPVATLSAGQFNRILPSQRPSFLQQSDIAGYDSLYSSLLGIVEGVSMSGALDGDLRALPPGTPLSTTHNLRAWELYLQDTWRLRPSVTLNFGISYGLQTAPVEREGKQTIAIYTDDGGFVLPQDYLRRKLEGAREGRVFNPQLAFQPVKNAGRETVFDADRNNWSPRVSAMWNPVFAGGLLAKLLGPGKSVVRGGYGLLFDRTNAVLITLVPSLSVGFSQSLQLNPINAQGQNHRVIVDGPIAIPIVASVVAPIVPRDELISVSIDPDLRTPRHHVVDFTIQREMGGGIVLELAYVGRMGRGLYQAVNLNNSPYMFLDPRSGQTFAQAYDALAAELRAGVPAENVSLQPWFENFLPGQGTRTLAASQRANIITGNISALFQFGLDELVAAPFNNRQVRDLLFVTYLGRSNYDALIATLTKRTSHGLHFDVSYTLSHSLDQVGVPQAFGQRLPNSFFPDTDYGPSLFDRRHVISARWIYDVPGLQRRPGWYGRLLRDWSFSGIVSASSGIPLGVTQSTQAYGGGLIGQPFLSTGTAAIPLRPLDYPNRAHRSVGSGGVGVTAAAGSGLNYFADPQAALENFRHIQLASDTRSGRGVLRSFPSWNLDVALGKTLYANGRLKASCNVDVFNLFNHPIFAPPSLNLSQRATFGVINAQMNSPRRIQAGVRVEW